MCGGACPRRETAPASKRVVREWRVKKMDDDEWADQGRAAGRPEELERLSRVRLA